MDYISSETLAARLELTVACLEKWRLAGIGPQWVRLGGAIRYAVGDVERWLRDQLTESELEVQKRQAGRLAR
jgi:hypothetical protein